MIISANVTDPTSATTVQCDGQTGVPLRHRLYKLTIMERDIDRGFRPCHYTAVKVNSSWRLNIVSKNVKNFLGFSLNCAWKTDGRQCEPDWQLVIPDGQEKV